MNNHGMPHNSNPLGSDTVVTPQLAVSPTNGFYAHEKGLGSIENACRIFDESMDNRDMMTAPRYSASRDVV